MKAILSVDYSNDFVSDDGKLTAGKIAQDLEEATARLLNDGIKNGDFVVFADDYHIEGDQHHPEFDLFPPHNLAGTEGRLLYGQIQSIYDQNKDKPNVHWIDKSRYSAFAGTDLDIKLRERGIQEVWISGVVTDICILHTAVDAYNLGYKIVIPKNCVASFNQAGHEWALTHFSDTLGAKVIDY